MGKLQWFPWMALPELDQTAERLPGAAMASGETGYAWTPAADVVETEAVFTVTLELPGVAREAVRVETKGRVLIVSGERPLLHEDGEGAYQVMERSYGPFMRHFALPRDSATQAIVAVLKDGVLTVSVPRILPERRHRRIPVG